MNSMFKFGTVCGLLCFTACSHVNFVPPDGVIKSTSCSGNLTTTKVQTKILFVLDMSGTNQSDVGCILGPNCTDPEKTMRAGSIQKFVADYGSHSNFTWGLETFQGTSAVALTRSGSGTFAGFSQLSGFETAIAQFKNMIDAGDTPYLSALDLAASLIAQDPDLHSATKPQYLVVFMSDGQPYGDPTNAGTEETILSELQYLMSLEPGRITLNTVYYGVNDMAASGLLSKMAKSGDGNFLDTTTNPSGLDFQISDLINVPCP